MAVHGPTASTRWSKPEARIRRSCDPQATHWPYSMVIPLGWALIRCAATRPPQRSHSESRAIAITVDPRTCLRSALWARAPGDARGAVAAATGGGAQHGGDNLSGGRGSEGG